MAQQHLAKSDPVLEAFDELRVLEVVAETQDTASTFLAKFQSTAASLGPDERIELMIYMLEGVELLKAVLFDAQADKICALHWEYDGEEDVNLVIPLLTNNCPQLASLDVNFRHDSTIDFVSSVLGHPSSKIKVLEMPQYTEGNLARFFAALEQSQVSALTVSSDGTLGFTQGLHEYLAKDLLVRLRIETHDKQVPAELIASFSNCVRLAELWFAGCDIFQPTAFAHLPKSISKLELSFCTFVGGFDWSFLADSNVRELDFSFLKGVDGNHLGSALAVHLRAKGLDELGFWGCEFVNETLAGVEIGRIKRLDIGGLDDDSVARIAIALQSPSNEVRELKLEYNRRTRRNIENHLVPALKHPSCSLAKLNLLTYQENQAAAKAVEDRFSHRRGLFALLQGQ